MLGVVTKALGLPTPIVRAAEPSWVLAETIHLGEGMSMFVIYRSTWLRDGDSGYEQVRAILERTEHEEIYRATRTDEDMMHGHGEWIIYVLNPVENPPPVATMLIKLVKDWGAPLLPTEVPAECAMRLKFEDMVGGMQ